MKGYLLIPADVNEPTSILTATKKTSLDVLQGAVGGTVQHIPLARSTDLWVHDEGKRLGFEPNPRAQVLFDAVFGPGRDFVVGPAVITGGVDQAGNTKPLDAGQITVLRTFYGENHE